MCAPSDPVLLPRRGKHSVRNIGLDLNTSLPENLLGREDDPASITRLMGHFLYNPLYLGFRSIFIAVGSYLESFINVFVRKESN